MFSGSLLIPHSSLPFLMCWGKGGTSLHVATREGRWSRDMGRADTLYKLFYPSFVAHV